MAQNASKLFLLFILASCIELSAQEESENKHSENKHSEHKHLVASSIGYTYIPKAGTLESNKAKGFFVPSIGLDYFYLLNEKWEIGVMADLELDHYLIINKELERENALITVVIGQYKPVPQWSFLAGGGAEFEHHENLALFRVGIARYFYLNNNWILGVPLIFDYKKGYDTWSLAIAIGKEF